MKEKIKLFIKRFKDLQGTPYSLARGVAIGTFIGFAPLMPLKSVLILLFTMIIPSSTVAAFLCTTIICNPLTYIPLYYVSWLIGNFILPGRASWAILSGTLQQILDAGFSEALSLVLNVGLDAGIVILTGGIILAVIPTLVSYPLALVFFIRFQKKRHEKHRLEQPIPPLSKDVPK
ncbi:MAG: hypothetical protein ACI8ZB_002390 [Desulforhopalus sp.]|jgi:uncharacterized protein (DUF2062 family)